jgi:hypothetical protein
MRENCQYGSEGGVVVSLLDPYISADVLSYILRMWELLCGLFHKKRAFLSHKQPSNTQLTHDCGAECY